MNQSQRLWLTQDLGPDPVSLELTLPGDRKLDQHGTDRRQENEREHAPAGNAQWRKRAEEVVLLRPDEQLFEVLQSDEGAGPGQTVPVSKCVPGAGEAGVDHDQPIHEDGG